MALAAKEAGIRTLFVPAENAAEATLARGPEVIPVSSIRQLAEHLNGERPIAPEPLWTPGGGAATGLDFQDVKGQENVKRALGDCRQPGGTMCCSSARRDLERACSASGCPLFCRT